VLRVAYQDIAVADRLAPADTLPGAFERTVEAHRSRIAVSSDTWTATYDELNITANRLAHALIARGGKPDDRVAILMQHDTPEVAALLAVLKAGCIALVLNPSHPPARLRQLIEDAAPAQVVTDRHNWALARDIAGLSCKIVSFEDNCRHGPAGNPAIACDPGQAALLVYTSGSTGIPKGVMQTHALRLRSAGLRVAFMAIAPGDRLSVFVPLGVGQGTCAAFCTLLNGATLLPFPFAAKGVTGLLEWMNRNRITHYISPTSVFRNFMSTIHGGAGLPQVRSVTLASESATSADLTLFQRHFSEACTFLHTLSSSEAGIIAGLRWSHGDAVPEGRLPLRFIDQGRTMSFVDEQGVAVPDGEVGEIVVRGCGLALGYWRNPAMTAERFLPADETGEAGYRTGDLGRIDSAGLLHFVGRTGTRVKIRGNSIELAEVAEAMGRLPGVERAAADVVERPRHEPVLIGYVVAHKGHSLTPAALRREARKFLPDHAVPSVMVVLDRFPLMPNGKIDRERLRQLRPQQVDALEPPQSETEMLLAGLWKDVLELPNVNRGDNFFELGGDSLIAAVVAARIYDRTGVELTLGSFADHPTLAELADVIDRRSREARIDEIPLVRVSRAGPLPLSFAQERIWRASQTARWNQSYTRIKRHRILGPLDRDGLRDALSFIVRRHEILRTTFAMQGGQPVQIVHPPYDVDLPFFDLAGAADAEQRADAILQQEAEPLIELAKLPLTRFALVRLRDDEHWLQRVVHHIVSDGWSEHIFQKELLLLYGAARGGEPPPLPAEQDLQYADYAAWERAALQPGSCAMQEIVAWWKGVLAGHAPGLPLPCRRPALWRWLARYVRLPLLGDFLPPVAGLMTWELERETSDRLDAVRRKLGATDYQLLLAAFVALLAVETGRDDILIGSYAANRKRLPLQDLYGPFINLIPLRFHYRPDRSFHDWLAIVRESVIAAEAHSALPFEMLCDELARQGHRRPKIGMVIQASAAFPVNESAELTITETLMPRRTMPWGFSMSAAPNNRRLTFDAYLYDPAAVRALVARYQRLLDAVSRHPEMTLRELLAMSRAGGDRADSDFAH
jgi:amino acid adenylation domain-containing protein